MSRSGQDVPPMLSLSRNIRATRWSSPPSLHIHDKVLPEEISAQNQWVFDHGAVGEVHLTADSLRTNDRVPIPPPGAVRRPSGDRICRHSMIGKRNCTPPNFCGNLNSAMSSCITSSRASSEDFAAPVSMRAGSLTPHGKRITSSTAPNVIFSSALAVPRTRRESTAKVKIRIRTISLLVGIFPTRKLYQIQLSINSVREI